MGKAIKNPEQTEKEPLKNPSISEVVRKAFQEGYKSGFADGFNKADELLVIDEGSDEEE